MYCGEIYTVLDDKNRISIPSRFRKTMEDQKHTEFYMCRGFDGCLFIFPRQEWEKIRRQTREHPALNAGAVDLRRMLFGSVQEVTPDNQGRIPVPEHLRNYACLDKEAALVGADDHIELWNRAGWREYQRRQEAQFREMVSDFFKVGAGSPGDESAAANEDAAITGEV